MTAAAVGLIGVVAGALVTAWFNQKAEKDRRHAEARVAAHLIAAELNRAATRLKSATGKKWWSDEISSAQWEAHASALAAKVSEPLLGKLARAYALLEVMEGRRIRSKGAPTEKDLARLATSSNELTGLAEWLQEDIPRSVLARMSKPINLAVAVGVALLAVVLLFSIFQPRAELTDETIAAGLQRELPEGSVVECSRGGDRWQCDVVYPQPSRQSCKASQPSLGSPAARLVATGGPQRSKTPCDLRARSGFPPDSFEVATGSQGPVAIPEEIPDPDEIEIDMHIEAIQVPVPKPSIFDRAKEWAFEGD